MAISKKRLEELVKQGATIYEVKRGKLTPVSLKQNIKYIYNDMVTFKPFGEKNFLHNKYFNKLFESKEDAQEYLEFGNVTRTERLQLPSWEKFQKGYKTDFCVGLSNFYLYIAKNNFNHYEKLIRISQDKYIDKGMYVNKDHIIIFEKELTKKNYYEARRLCVKLFKGESE